MSRPRKSLEERKVIISVPFDPVVLHALDRLAKRWGRTRASMIQGCVTNSLLIAGELGVLLRDGQEPPEFNIRFNQYVTHDGKTILTRRMNDPVSEDENSLGSGEILHAADMPGDGIVKSPAPVPSPGDGHPDRAGHRRERVRL